MFMFRVIFAVALVSFFLHEDFCHGIFITSQKLEETESKNDDVNYIVSQFQRTSYDTRIFFKYTNINHGENRHDYYETTMHAPLRISFQLHDPAVVMMTNIFNHHMSCKEDLKKWNRAAVPNLLQRFDGNLGRSGRVLEFTTTIATNLKIMLVGDSVLVQFSELFDEMLGGSELKSRETLWYAWKDHSGSTIVAPTRGGGVSALLRMTGLLSRSSKGKRPANYHGGGWNDNQFRKYLDHQYYTNKTSKTNKTVGSFDAIILRVMHGWMALEEITRDRIIEAINLSHELLGVKTVVLMNIPFTNNVQTMDDYYKVKAINRDINQIANTWNEIRSDYGIEAGGVLHVLVQDYANYCIHVIWSNAIHLGYNVSHPLQTLKSSFDDEAPLFLFDRLKQQAKFPPTIAMVCDNRNLTQDGSECRRNFLWKDGMHVCPETMSARFGASVACLLGCVYNGPTPVANKTRDTIRECEKECNEQFMSVMPVDESWIDEGVTLASFTV